MTSLIPRRCCLCLRCRTALFAGELCPCSAESHAACFDTPQERQRIVEAVWGGTEQPPDRASPRARQGLPKLSSAASLALGAGSVVALVASSSALAFTALVGGTACCAVTALSRSGRIRRRPRGGLVPPTGFHSGPHGTIRGTHQLLSPAGARECLAYCVELSLVAEGSEALMYRDAVTSGFEVDLENGALARVSAGRFYLHGPAPELGDVDNLELESYLKSVDPGRPLASDLDPLHFNVVREEILVEGDRIELSGAFEPVASGRGPRGYRESAPFYLAPQGLAEVRLLP